MSEDFLSEEQVHQIVGEDITVKILTFESGMRWIYLRHGENRAIIEGQADKWSLWTNNYEDSLFAPRDDKVFPSEERALTEALTCLKHFS